MEQNRLKKSTKIQYFIATFFCDPQVDEVSLAKFFLDVIFFWNTVLLRYDCMTNHFFDNQE